MVGRRLHRFAIAAVLGLWCGLAAAEEPGALEFPGGRRPWDLTADEVEYERDRQLYVARGNVRLVQGERTVTADWMSLSNATGIAVASGDVVIREGEDTLRADFVEFDVETLEGVIFDGRLESVASRFRLEGAELRRTGPETYAIEQGRFTTCRCPEPGRDPWAIRAEHAELEPDGDATARNTSFEVLGVPVLWVPWMTYPLRTERKTGFLLPELNASSRSGTDVGVPFFWAAAPNLNVTLTPAFVSRRGFKPRAEVEYVFGEESGGELLATFIHDRDVDSDDPGEPFDDDRWAFSWLHDQHLPAGWRFKVDALAMSDNLYPFDFNELSETRSDHFLVSRGFVERHFGPGGWLGLNGGVRVAEDLQNPDDADRDDFLLQRLPELGVVALPRRLGPLPLVGSLDVAYANFLPADSPESDLGLEGVGPDLFLDTGIDAIPDGRERNRVGQVVPGDAHRDDFDPALNPRGTEGDGFFQEGEPLADKGQRVLVAPRLGAPLRLGDLFELYPEVGWYATFYDSHTQGSELRSLLTARLDLRTRLRRAFALPFGGGAAVHLLEPRIGWAYVSDSDQDDNPLFVPGTALPQTRLRELALDNVTRDTSDRIVDTNALVLAFDNRILRRDADGAAAPWAEVSLLGAYRFDRGEFGLVILEGAAWPLASSRARFHVSYDPEERVLSEALTSIGWTSESGHEALLSYRYRRNVPRFFEAFPWDDRYRDENEAAFDRIQQLDLGLRVAVTPQWALTYRGAYSFEQSFSITNQAGVEYVSRCRCWAIRLEFEDERERGVGFGIRYRLIGIGDDTVRPFGSRGVGVGRAFLDVPANL